MKLVAKIAGFSMIFFFLLAFILYVNGVEHVDFDDRYYRFFMLVNTRFSDWKLTIPNIPSIEELEGGKWWALILNAFIWFINNVIIGIGNIAIAVMNYVIWFIQYIAAILTILFEDFKNIIVDGQSTSSSSNQYHVLPII